MASQLPLTARPRTRRPAASSATLRGCGCMSPRSGPARPLPSPPQTRRNAHAALRDPAAPASRSSSRCTPSTPSNRYIARDAASGGPTRAVVSDPRALRTPARPSSRRRCEASIGGESAPRPTPGSPGRNGPPPSDLRQDLDGLGAVEELEASARALVDGPRQLDLERTSPLFRHLAVVNREAEPLGLDPHPLDARGPARKRFAERPARRLLRRKRLGVTEGDPGAVDPEPMAACVDRAGNGDALGDITQVAAGDHRQAHVRRPDQRGQAAPHVRLEPRLRWIGHVRGQRAVVVGHEEQTAATAEPMAEPVREHRGILGESFSHGITMRECTPPPTEVTFHQNKDRDYADLRWASGCAP